MRHSEPTADCGVIIGRFQVADLHEGHHELIGNVLARHRKVVVLLGIAPVAHTINNPLDFESRKQMIQAAYPNIIVLYIEDVNDDALWSKQVDRTIGYMLSPTQTALLYGSRDSFIKHYSGRFDTYELPTQHSKSGTEIRAEIGQYASDSPEWRAGVIWASRNRYATSYQAVDVAIFSPDYSQILLGKKKGEDLWRLIGGFADPLSPSLEDDARREAFEEAGVTLDSLEYIKSMVIDDWRYHAEPDCIKSALFIATTTSEPKADDDIEYVCWFNRSEIDPTNQTRIMPLHRKLVTYANLRASQILTTKGKS
jgi:bifunctional NMN adenylyltransferase/nudix hydrolase